MIKLKKIFKVFLVSSYLVLGFSTVYKSWVIDNNYNNLISDYSAMRVDRIDTEDTIYLQNGDAIINGNIDTYIKIKKGRGTWYIEEGKALAVEMTDKEYAKIYTPFITIGLLLGWIYRKKYYILPLILGYGLACIFIF